MSAKSEKVCRDDDHDNDDDDDDDDDDDNAIRWVHV